MKHTVMFCKVGSFELFYANIYIVNFCIFDKLLIGTFLSCCLACTIAKLGDRV